jgi:hypothetical protein
MEATFSKIAADLLTVVTPFLSSGATEFAKRVGSESFDATKKLVTMLKARFTDDPKATEHLARFEADPVLQRDDFSHFLAARLEEDASLRTRATDLLEPLAPQLHIIEKICTAEHVTGIVAEEMSEGTLKVDLDVQEAKHVVGAKVKRIGR